MNPLDEYLSQDRTLTQRLTAESDKSVRLQLITESIRSGEAALHGATDPAGTANVMLGVAASHLLAATETDAPGAPEHHARQAAAWATRTVQAAGAAPGPVLHFVPRAATVVAAALPYLPQDTRQPLLQHIDGWARSVTDALTSQPATGAEGTRDLAVGLALLEGAPVAEPSEAPGLRARATALIQRAHRLLSEAGETALADHARQALDQPPPTP